MLDCDVVCEVVEVVVSECGEEMSGGVVEFEFVEGVFEVGMFVSFEVCEVGLLSGELFVEVSL